MWWNKEGIRDMNASLGSRVWEEVECFKYLRVDAASNRRMECEVAIRVKKSVIVFWWTEECVER